MRLFSSLFSVPELAEYSDEEFDRLVWQAKLRRGDAVWVVPMAAGLLAAAAWMGFGALLTYGLKSAGSGLVGAPFKYWLLGNAFVALLTAIAAGACVRWVMIVRSVRRIINRAGCPFCEFSLVGLKVQHGWVRCPECGQRVYLHEHKLTPEDLVTEAQKRAPLEGAGPMGALKGPGSKRQTAGRRG